MIDHILAGLPPNGLDISERYDLTRWIKQDVLILPEGLTVPLNACNHNHKDLWLELMLLIIDKLNSRKDELCFLLIGEEGEYYEDLISHRHLIFKTTQPGISQKQKGVSIWPGCDELMNINHALKAMYKPQIQW